MPNEPHRYSDAEIQALGRVPAFYPRPMFEDAGWGRRLKVEQVLFENGWPDDAKGTPTAY